MAILRLLGRLPLSWLHGAGAALGWLVYWASPTYARRLRENLLDSGLYSREKNGELVGAAIAEAGKGVTEVAAGRVGECHR